MHKRVGYVLHFREPVVINDGDTKVTMVGPFESAKAADDWCAEYELDNGRHIPTIDAIEVLAMTVQ